MRGIRIEHENNLAIALGFTSSAWVGSDIAQATREVPLERPQRNLGIH